MNSTTVSGEYEDYALTQSDKDYIRALDVLDEVLSVTFIIVTGLGILSNVLVYITVNHLQKNAQFQNSSLTYLKWLAVADTTSVIIDGWLTKGWVYFFGYEFRSLGLWICRTHMWVSHFTTRAACNIMATFTVDRFISFKFPFFYGRTLKKPFYARLFSTIIWILCAIVAAPLLYMLVIRDDRCTISSKISPFVIDVFIFIGTPVCLVGIPASMVIFSNIMIMLGLRKRSKAKKKQMMKQAASGNSQNTAGGTNQTQKTDENQLTALLIGSSVFFIFCESWVMWGNYVMFYSEADEKTPPELTSQFRSTATTISEFAGGMNSSMNFFIFIVCSKRFFAAFKELMSEFKPHVSGGTRPGLGSTATGTTY